MAQKHLRRVFSLLRAKPTSFCSKSESFITSTQLPKSVTLYLFHPIFLSLEVIVFFHCDILLLICSLLAQSLLFLMGSLRKISSNVPPKAVFWRSSPKGLPPALWFSLLHPLPTFATLVHPVQLKISHLTMHPSLYRSLKMAHCVVTLTICFSPTIISKVS